MEQPSEHEFEAGPKPVTRLLADLLRESTTLLRNEIQLAKAELGQKVSTAGAGAVALAVGGVLAFAGLLVLLAAAVIALAIVVPWWAAALIVGGLVSLVGLILLMRARSNLREAASAPKATVTSLRRDKDVIQEQMR